MKNKGTINGDSLIWKEGMENWTRAEDVEDLKVLFPAAPPIPEEE